MIRKSQLLGREGFRHGFSTRHGGVSEAPFDTMNLARAVGDDPSRVEENYRRFAAMVGVDPAAVRETSQVHGANVLRAAPGDDVPRTRALEADALVATDAGVVVAVRVADCVPILLADPDSGAVAAVHAGWRGAVLGVLDRAIDALVGSGTTPSRLIAAIGPHIGPESFEVGEDVAAEIEAAARGESVVVRGYDKPHVDLGRVIEAQLRARGVHERRIERVFGCTYANATDFHSFRRDGKRSGRLLAAIEARAAGDPAAW